MSEIYKGFIPVDEVTFSVTKGQQSQHLTIQTSAYDFLLVSHYNSTKFLYRF